MLTGKQRETDCPMDLNTLISQYGYAALVIGSLAEGETVTLLGGVAASGAIKVPAGGTFCGAWRHDWRPGALSVRAAVWRQAITPFLETSG